MLALGVLQPGIDLPLGLVFGNAVPLLDLADQLDATALHEVKIIVRELAPLLLNLAAELLQLPSIRSQFMRVYSLSHAYH